MRYLVIFLALLAGCVADNKSKQESKAEDKIEVVPRAVLDKTVEAQQEKLVAQVRADQANNHAQLSGHITGMIHQIRADFSELVKVHATATATATATAMLDIRTQFDSVVKATAELTANTNIAVRTNATASAEISAKLADQMKLLSDLEVKIGKLEMQAAAAASAQVGYKNQFEQKLDKLEQTLTAQAGRDVVTNYFPKETVYILRDVTAAFVAILVALCGVATTVISRAYKASRERAEQRHVEELAENRRLGDIIVALSPKILPREAESTRTPSDTIRPVDRTTLSG